MRKAFKWQHIYFLLAGLDILAVAISLFLSHHMSNEYSKVVAENLRWASLQGEIDQVLKLAQETNAPGNDVFDSLKPKEERLKVVRLAPKFEDGLEVLKKDVLSLSHEKEHEQMLSKFSNIKMRMAEMLAEAELIFNYFEMKQNQKAASRMATMDRKYALLQDAIGELKIKIREIQKDLFLRQQIKGARLKQIENFFAGFIVFMVLGVAFYGRKMSRFVEAAQAKENEDQKRIIAQQAVLTENAKMSALGVMAGGIAHELNNPLSIIVGKASQTRERMLKTEVPSAKIIEAFEKIEKVSERMAKIIHGIKTFSRDATNDPFKDESLSVLVEETLELCREKLKKFDVSIEAPQFGDLFVPCRATQISQVLLNLISNSIDAISKLPERWIRIEYKIEDNFLNLSVTDSGAGIPEEVAQRLMTPFYTTKEVGKGTGLGLSISKGILEQHKGLLWLNTKHKNTQFCLRLPLHQVGEEQKGKAA